MTDEELRQEILKEMEDIAPETLEEVLHLIKKRKQEEDEEDLRESRLALAEAKALGTTSLSDFRKEFS